jgi:hypothetical protein
MEPHPGWVGLLGRMMENENHKSAESFRDNIEARLVRLEGRAGEWGTDPLTVDSAAGLLRTYADRILQVETIQAENRSAILRALDLMGALRKEFDEYKASKP